MLGAGVREREGEAIGLSEREREGERGDMARRGSGERAREMEEMADAIRFLFLFHFLWKEWIGNGDRDGDGQQASQRKILHI